MTATFQDHAWPDWDAVERDAGTGFDEVYPDFKGRHDRHRTRMAVRPLPWDISLPSQAPIDWTDAGLSGEIWIPPYARSNTGLTSNLGAYLVFIGQGKYDGPISGSLSMRLKIGSIYSKSLFFVNQLLDPWRVKVSYWPAVEYPGTDLASMLDTVQEVRIEYRVADSTGNCYLRNIDGIDSGKSKAGWFAWMEQLDLSFGLPALPGDYPRDL